MGSGSTTGRASGKPDGFKALAYVYQANHGQFNRR
jgi:hypothetical protein